MIGKLDKEIIEKFKEFKNETKKHDELCIEDVEFIECDIFNDEENVELIGSKKIGSHDELERINDKNGIPVYDASANILTYVKKDKFLNEVFTVQKNENPDISFASEGNSSAGTNFAIHRDSYFVNNHRTVIKFTDKYYSKYVYYSIFKMKDKYGFKRGYIPSQTELKRLKITVPIPKDLNKFYSSYQIQEAIVEFLEFWKDGYTDIIREDIEKKESIYQNIRKIVVKNTFKYDKFLVERFNRFARNKGYSLTLQGISFTETNFFEEKQKNLLLPKKLEKNQQLILENSVENGVPVYSGGKEKICYVDKNRYLTKIFIPVEDNPDISFANNGDGSAGRNFFIHKTPYFVNQERTVISFKNDFDYYSLYIYHFIKDMRDKYNMNRDNRPTPKDLPSFKIQIQKPLDTNKYTSKDVQQILVYFWEDLIAQIDKQLEIYKRMSEVSDIIDKAFLYRTFSKIEWSKE